MGIITTTTPTDVLIITATSGSKYGISKRFYLEENSIYDWTYKVRGSLPSDDFYAQIDIINGDADVDWTINTVFENISASGYANAIRVSGNSNPGVFNWSYYDGQYWNIKHRIRANDPGTTVDLSLYLNPTSGTQKVYLDAVQIEKRTAESVQFNYCDGPVLGLNWEGNGQLNINENLFNWSEGPALWDNNANSTNYTYGIDGYNGTDFFGSGQILTYEFPSGSDIFLDDTLTLKFYSRSDSIPTNNYGNVTIAHENNVLYSGQFKLTSAFNKTTAIFSGVDILMPSGLTISWNLPDGSNHIVFSQLQLHHGSGTTTYVPTYQDYVQKYRYEIAAEDLQSISWPNLYARVYALPLTATLNSVVESGKALLAEASNSDRNYLNFPTAGVVDVNGQKFEYANRQGESFGEAQPGWYGTNLNLSNLISGSVMTYFPLPLPVSEISGTTIKFENPIPLPNHSWKYPVRLQFYNNKVENLDRYSLAAASIPLTRAVGNLVTSFIQHASDQEVHFHRDQICSMIANPANWCATPDIDLFATLSRTRVEEINEDVALTLNTRYFMSENTKEITITWGDGTTSTYTKTGTTFGPFTHTYTLPTVGYPVTYTIQSRVKDTNLNIIRRTSSRVTVEPTTKGVQSAGAVLSIPYSGVQTASATIMAQLSGVQAAAAYIISG